MAREPELSIKVKVDPQIDAAKLQEDINKKIPIKGFHYITRDYLICSIADWNADNG